VFVGRSMVMMGGVGAPSASCTDPVGGAPASALRSAAGPPLLNAATSLSDSASGILRSIVIVTGAVASAPPAVFTVAVAVKASAPACACASVAQARDTATARPALIVVCRMIITVSTSRISPAGPLTAPDVPCSSCGYRRGR
jgi:hypothetical protein